MSDFLNKANAISAGRIPPQRPVIKGPEAKPGTNFREMLRTSLNEARPQEIVFSKHAQARVEQRGVELSPEKMEKLSEAVNIAKEKGISDSLIYLSDTAFIVNIPGRVVVTVVDSQELTQNVFTNIDGAVIL